MYLGRPFLFQCDFCQARIEQFGPGLPPGMKWLAGNYLAGTSTRHICKACVSADRHGEETLHDSGKH